MNPHSYNLELGTILRRLPLCFYEKGRIPAIRSAYANGYANRLWPRAEAVRVAFLANMESAEAHGNGNKAKRRAGVHVPAGIRPGDSVYHGYATGEYP